jgi:hypothetical protein
MVDGAIEIASSSTATTVKRVHFAKIVRIVVSPGGGCGGDVPHRAYHHRRLCGMIGSSRWRDARIDFVRILQRPRRG